MSRRAFNQVRGRGIRGSVVASLTAFAMVGCDTAGGSRDAILGDLPGILADDSPATEAAGPEGNVDGAPTIAPGVQVGGEEALAIRDAAVAYVRQATAINEVTVEIDAVSEGWARLRVLPGDDQTDPATLYMRREGTVWRGVAIGTGFTPPDLDEMGVPVGVRP